MSLSTSTLIIFLFLIPAVAFRYLIYIKSVVKRPIGAGNFVHVIVNALTISFVIQIFSAFLLLVMAVVAQYAFGYDYKIRIDVFQSEYYFVYNYHRMGLEKFFVTHFRFVLWYLLALTITTWVLAWLFSYLARRYRSIGRLLYGPLATFMSGPAETLVYGFVLTKIQNGKDRVVYMGFVEEIALKDGSNIDHIVLADPIKYYFRMNQRVPVTTYNNARAVSRESFNQNMMYISGIEIENVHFDQFYQLLGNTK